MACNHLYTELGNHARCVRCGNVISLQAYYRWLEDRERRKEKEPKKKPNPPRL